MTLQNIPHELRTLPQWCAAGTDKDPLNPRTGQRAKVNDPSTWGTFEEAVHSGYKHIGFVLSDSDPYCVIDLDNPELRKVNGVVEAEPDRAKVATISERHRRILEAFDSYAELSQSGTGVHIVCRGRVPRGVRRDKVEVYSSLRYMIFTGNIVKNLPIAEQQPLITALFEEMQQDAPGMVELEQVEGVLTDDELYQMASTATNAAKFLDLWQGNWAGKYESQSEADFALISMLGFYSLDNEQVRRVFRFSALGQRDKATKNDKYIDRALAKMRAKLPPPVDFSALLARGSALVPAAELPAPEPQQPKPPLPLVEVTATGTGWEEETRASKPNLELPPGFIGEVASYIYSSAIRPVPEIALCAAIALTAGVVGRCYNISGTGLNQYLIMLAKTGSGKEGAATGIDAMVSAVRAQVPMIDEFIGPGVFSSGQALVRVLDSRPCFVSVLGEFGFTLQQICSPKASNAEKMLKRVLLDIYAKSGDSKVLRPSVYSDSDKNTKSVHAPNVTILGESTPEIFYENLDATGIAEGLIPRFSIFEYTGPRPDTNPNAFAPPPERLVRDFGSLAAVAMAAQQNRVCSPVQQDKDTLRIMREFDKHATDQINKSGADVSKQLWNRAHLKALKLAALATVGVNPHQPIINRSIAEWAIKLVNRDIETLQGKFENGEVGSGDVRLELDIRRAIGAYLRMSQDERRSYGCPEKMTTLQLVPFHYLRRRLRLLVSFKNDRRGATNTLNQTLNAMVEGEVLTRLNPIQTREQCGTNSPVFGLGPAWTN